MNIFCFNISPGGQSLTRKAVELGEFKTGAKLLDIGCGRGESLEFLRKEYEFIVTGLDKNPEFCGESAGIIAGSAEKLPFSDSSFDGILMQCSFSLTEEPDKVLEECLRVLNSSGKLIISDIYARGNTAILNGCLSRLEKKESLISLIQEHHFDVESFEDCSPCLQSLWGQMIFDQGAESFHQNLSIDPSILKSIRCGYYIMSAVRQKENRS